MPEHRGETRENSGRIRFFRLEPASQKHLERGCFFGVLSRRMQNTRQTQIAAFEPPKHTSGARSGEAHRAEAVARLTVCPNAGKGGPKSTRSLLGLRVARCQGTSGGTRQRRGLNHAPPTTSSEDRQEEGLVGPKNGQVWNPDDTRPNGRGILDTRCDGDDEGVVVRNRFYAAPKELELVRRIYKKKGFTNVVIQV